MQTLPPISQELEKHGIHIQPRVALQIYNATIRITYIYNAVCRKLTASAFNTWKTYLLHALLH